MTRSSAGWARQGAICLLSVQFTFTQESRERPAQLTSLLSHQANDYYCRERERERDGWGHTQINWLGGSSGVKTLEMLTREILGVPDGKCDPIEDPCLAPNIAYYKEFCSVDKIFFETFPNLAVVSP